MSNVSIVSRMGRKRKSDDTRRMSAGGDSGPGDSGADSGSSSASGGQHKTTRTSVQVPDEWLAIARQRARINRQPLLWYLLGLIHEDAVAAGITNLPALPWGEEPTSNPTA